MKEIMMSLNRFLGHKYGPELSPKLDSKMILCCFDTQNKLKEENDRIYQIELTFYGQKSSMKILNEIVGEFEVRFAPKNTDFVKGSICRRYFRFNKELTKKILTKKLNLFFAQNSSQFLAFVTHKKTTPKESNRNHFKHFPKRNPKGSPCSVQKSKEFCTNSLSSYCHKLQTKLEKINLSFEKIDFGIQSQFDDNLQIKQQLNSKKEFSLSKFVEKSKKTSEVQSLNVSGRNLSTSSKAFGYNDINPDFSLSNIDFENSKLMVSNKTQTNCKFKDDKMQKNEKGNSLFRNLNEFCIEDQISNKVDENATLTDCLNEIKNPTSRMRQKSSPMKPFFNVLDTQKTKNKEVALKRKLVEFEGINSPLLSDKRKQSFPFIEGFLNNCRHFEKSNNSNQNTQVKKKVNFNDFQNLDFMKTETSYNQFLKTESKNLNYSSFKRQSHNYNNWISKETNEISSNLKNNKFIDLNFGFKDQSITKKDFDSLNQEKQFADFKVASPYGEYGITRTTLKSNLEKNDGLSVISQTKSPIVYQSPNFGGKWGFESQKEEKKEKINPLLVKNRNSLLNKMNTFLKPINFEHNRNSDNKHCKTDFKIFSISKNCLFKETANDHNKKGFKTFSAFKERKFMMETIDRFKEKCDDIKHKIGSKASLI